MFARTMALSFAAHRDLRVLETNDHSFARAETLAPIVYDEMADIAREYPIVFPDNGTDLPCALLGLEAGHNAYVDAGGNWQATYVPLHIRRYPFMFGRTNDPNADANRFVILFDPEAPHFRSASGHPVFDTSGQLSEHMRRRVALLEQIQNKVEATRAMVRAIGEAGLLAEKIIRIKTGNEPEHRIQGLRVVDEDVLRRLPGDRLADLAGKGALALVYAQLLSWANFRQGPLAGKYPHLAERPEVKNPPFLFENDSLDFSNLS
jgi:hypothetical protein